MWAGLRELAVHNATGAPPRPLAALAATPLAAAAAATPCHFLHPGRTCAGNAAAAFPGAYARALRVYLPVYLLPALLVHRGLLLAGRQRPRLLAKLALGVGRSSLFLGLYVSLAFAGVCSGHRLAGATTGAMHERAGGHKLLEAEVARCLPLLSLQPQGYGWVCNTGQVLAPVQACHRGPAWHPQ